MLSAIMVIVWHMKTIDFAMMEDGRVMFAEKHTLMLQVSNFINVQHVTMITAKQVNAKLQLRKIMLRIENHGNSFQAWKLIH